jgi:hypothetical protein
MEEAEFNNCPRSEKDDESQSFSQENLQELQGHSTQRFRARYLQCGATPQAATGLVLQAPWKNR